MNIVVCPRCDKTGVPAQSWMNPDEQERGWCDRCNANDDRELNNLLRKADSQHKMDEAMRAIELPPRSDAAAQVIEDLKVLGHIDEDGTLHDEGIDPDAG
jgi:transposase